MPEAILAVAGWFCRPSGRRFSTSLSALRPARPLNILQCDGVDRKVTALAVLHGLYKSAQGVQAGQAGDVPLGGQAAQAEPEALALAAVRGGVDDKDGLVVGHQLGSADMPPSPLVTTEAPT